MLWRDLLHITYCTNVHPGEGLEALHRVICDEVGATRALLPRELLRPKEGFGLGLRVGAEAAQSLGSAQERARLAQSLSRVQGYAFTVNGFPYGDFAAPRVKESVYQPSWCDEERLSYTLSLARALVDLPGPSVRSISTVAGRYEPEGMRGLPVDVGQRIGQQLGALARGLAALENETGVCVRVALEPEPATTLETTADAVEFFERYVWPAEPLTRRYIGLCYDTCHQAVMFEDPLEAWRRLAQAGVPVFKVQISNALSLQSPHLAEARATLATFSEPRYLHQVTARLDGKVERLIDLPELINERGLISPERQAWAGAEEWRCHFHVPLWWRGAQPLGLGTTHEHWRAIARHVAGWAGRLAHLPAEERALRLPHLEVETYSWGVIPSAHRAQLGELHSCVALEIKALWEELEVGCSVDA